MIDQPGMRQNPLLTLHRQSFYLQPGRKSFRIMYWFLGPVYLLYDSGDEHIRFIMGGVVPSHWAKKLDYLKLSMISTIFHKGTAIIHKGAPI